MKNTVLPFKGFSKLLLMLKKASHEYFVWNGCLMSAAFGYLGLAA